MAFDGEDIAKDGFQNEPIPLRKPYRDWLSFGRKRGEIAGLLMGKEIGRESADGEMKTRGV